MLVGLTIGPPSIKVTNLHTSLSYPDSFNLIHVTKESTKTFPRKASIPLGAMNKRLAQTVLPTLWNCARLLIHDALRDRRFVRNRKKKGVIPEQTRASRSFKEYSHHCK
jgi:hypothetical protein